MEPNLILTPSTTEARSEHHHNHGEGRTKSKTPAGDWGTLPKHSTAEVGAFLRQEAGESKFEGWLGNLQRHILN